MIDDSAPGPHDVDARRARAALPANANPSLAGSRPRSRRPAYIAVIIGGTMVALLAVGIIPRISSRRALEAAVVNETTGKPIVATAIVKRAAVDAELTLPGSVQAVQQTAVYGRTSGYVKRWYADIGARVRAGDVLAEIETPEGDQELRQARASLVRTRATLGLATSSLERFRSLASGGVVTPQEFEERRATFETTQAAVAEAEAYVERLLARDAAKRVKAPFSGTITARNVDVGTLISTTGGSSGAGGGGTTASAMFTLAQIDTVRVIVSVPQSSAPEIKVGQSADIVVREFAGRTFKGTVARTSAALDPSTRTLLAEIEIPNRDRALLAGMYAGVRFALTRASPPLVVPAAALVMSATSPRVAVVGNDGRIVFREVEIARDLGATVEVVSGVSAGEAIVINPSEALVDGVAVDARKAPEAKPADAKPGERTGAAPAKKP